MDTETTGLSPRAGHRIISISLVEVFDAAETGSHLDLILDPGRAIPDEATAVHGIRDADVRGGTRPRFADVASQISAFIGESRLVGYNLGFDLDFLAAEFAASGGLPSAMTWAGIDVMTLFQRAHSGGRRPLRDACEELGLDVAALRAHSARDDAAATALLYIALRSRHLPPQWDFLVRGSEVSVATYRDAERYYDDEDLQAAWELFETKNYEAALARALTAVTRDEARRDGGPDGLAYELACMILRRQAFLNEEHELLWRYFRRSLGPGVTAEQIIALAVPPWGVGGARAVQVVDDDQDGLPPISSRRPQPQQWEMAARVARVTERLEKKPETNEERLARALTALPSEAAFTEVAVCIRKTIMDRVKAHQDVRDCVLRLHRIAQQHAFAQQPAVAQLLAVAQPNAVA